MLRLIRRKIHLPVKKAARNPYKDRFKQHANPAELLKTYQMQMHLQSFNNQYQPAREIYQNSLLRPVCRVRMHSSERSQVLRHQKKRQLGACSDK